MDQMTESDALVLPTVEREAVKQQSLRVKRKNTSLADDFNLIFDRVDSSYFRRNHLGDLLEIKSTGLAGKRYVISVAAAFDVLQVAVAHAAVSDFNTSL